MISTKRLSAASFALVFSFLTLIAPAFAAGANQGSSDSNVSINYSGVLDFVTPQNQSVIDLVSVATAPQDSSGFSTYGLYIGTSTFSGNIYAVYALAAGIADVPYSAAFYYDTQSRPHVLFMSNASNAGSSLRLYTYRTSTSASSNFSLDNVTGYYLADLLLSGYGGYAAPSDASFFSSYSDAVDAIVNGSSSSGAVLVSNGDSFDFNSDYSVDNTTGVDIAVASYNLGANDIIVIGCYETVVVPGTIGGMSANYNVNQTLPREQHIPIRYCSLISDTTFSSLSPFESLEDAVSACYGILQDSPNHGGGYTPSDVQFTLQPGNVAYIEMADLTEKVILSSAKSSYSALFQTAGSYWPGNQLYKFGMDYPTTGTVLPGATPNQIPWQKNEWGSENALGQTKQAYAEITASSNLLMIYNPYYQGDDSSTLTNTNLINSAIVISSKGIARNGIRVYNLKDSFSTVDGNYYYGIGSINPNGYGDYFQSDNDPNATNPDVTGWTDENGDPTTAPGVTPYNDPPDNDSLADVITGFLSNIGSLFTQGHDAIKNLVESSSEFTSRLSSLYAWLPAPVYSVLMSAIILAIIVGVLKVFL